MKEKKRRLRLIITIIVIFCLASLCVWYIHEYHIRKYKLVIVVAINNNGKLENITIDDINLKIDDKKLNPKEVQISEIKRYTQELHLTRETYKLAINVPNRNLSENVKINHNMDIYILIDINDKIIVDDDYNMPES